MLKQWIALVYFDSFVSVGQRADRCLMSSSCSTQSCVCVWTKTSAEPLTKYWPAICDAYQRIWWNFKILSCPCLKTVILTANVDMVNSLRDISETVNAFVAA